MKVIEVREVVMEVGGGEGQRWIGEKKEPWWIEREGGKE